MFGHMARGPKQITERFQQYPSAPYAHEQYSPQYSYEPPPTPTQYVPSSPIISKHGHHGGHKSNAAMSALTLLAFLFFLNILQQCLKDHMSSMNTTPIMIMSGGREGEEPLAKASDVKKVDKTGQINKPVNGAKPKLAKIDWVTSKADERTDNDKFTKINLAQREKPRENGFPGFVSAMNKD